MRSAGRLRLGLGGGAMLGFSGYSPALGVGLTFDLGVTFSDRLSVFLHGELATVVFTVIGSGGVVFEYAVSDFVIAGLGAAFSGRGVLLYGRSWPFLGLTFPFRISFATMPRGVNETRHSGLLFGLQLAPGFSFPQDDPYQSLPAEAAFVASVSVGYAWW